MESIALLFSFSGRVARKPFALAAGAVYLVSFLSQFLLAAPVVMRASILPFLLVQILTGWAWTALHIKRLRDAGRPIGGAIALAILFALGLILFLIVIAILVQPATSGPNAAPATDYGQVLLLIFLIAILLNTPSLGVFAYVIFAVLVLVMLPILIAVGFTIWVGTRPTAAHSPATGD
jgi:uncharacterized membrane protein YhaH (DUF805 family)